MPETSGERNQHPHYIHDAAWFKFMNRMFVALSRMDVEGLADMCILSIKGRKSGKSSTGCVIGTLVGISMLFSETSRLAISLTARKLTNKLA